VDGNELILIMTFGKASLEAAAERSGRDEGIMRESLRPLAAAGAPPG
jgi:hypothetical protein